MNRTRLLAAVSGLIVGVTAVAYVATVRQPSTEAAPAASTLVGRVAAAGPGRVEPISEEVRVSAQLAGRLERVLVEEGDMVRAGQALAILEHADHAARVKSAEAEVRLREAEARRVRHGARDEERREAAAAERAALATFDEARRDSERRAALFAAGAVSAEENDRTRDEMTVAAARFEAAQQRHALIEATAREEEQASADATLALARSRLDEARAVLAKTTVRAPIAGTVLRKHRKAGETVSTQFDSPIVTIADRSRLRVRVDIDENDVAKIQIGQRAYVTADAYPSRRFYGRVVRVAQILGKKNVRTDEPTERVDTKVLETLVDLDGADMLPLGLRVQAFIEAATDPLN